MSAETVAVEESAERRVPRRQIALLVAATFGVAMASIVPMSFSLAVRIEQIAPGRTDLLGIVLGVGAAATLVVAPLTGQLSDHTRSRWGRRRPYTVLGALVGVAASPLLMFAPNVPTLALGWVIGAAAWNTVGGSLANWQADRLPRSQRGIVSGVTGLVMQVAPVAGILLVGVAPDSAVFVILVPVAAGLLFVIPFVALVGEPDSRETAPRGGLSLGRVIRSYGFRPRRFPNFSWNWLGRFVLFLGVMMTSSFSVLLFAQRLGLGVSDVAGVLAISSGFSVVTASVGSLLGGWLSDRVRRQSLALAGALVFAGGGTVLALAQDLVGLIGGILATSFGMALFAAPSQALSLDVLPNRETEAGRYMAITAFSQKIPSAVGPLLAPVVLSVGASSGGSNFALLYSVSAVCAVIGGCIICFAVKEET
ncbi:MFS transporter [Microbacterium halophytorum]|uniref:MFS transporter n=1 Tax=Microbacterium halophytorum TaxID=2067568 RepID=UPI000CFD9CCA|nr:MFS transporter [Microbacterium halophytorum]